MTARSLRDTSSQPCDASEMNLKGGLCGMFASCGWWGPQPPVELLAMSDGIGCQLFHDPDQRVDEILVDPELFG